MNYLLLKPYRIRRGLRLALSISASHLLHFSLHQHEEEERKRSLKADYGPQTTNRRVGAHILSPAAMTLHLLSAIGVALFAAVAKSSDEIDYVDSSLHSSALTWYALTASISSGANLRTGL